ncbi:MAG: RNA polymerase sigma factor [Oscillospiraceae bacterium]|nr:RNA polymerase sigma factor [Oscillospiraceae bacterium]
MVSSSYSSEEFLKIYNRHVDTVYRICFSFMKNSSDTEDMVQETFLKLLSNGKRFESESHEKAWLIVTASNACKDALKHWWRKNADIADCEALAQDAPFEMDGILSAVLELPADYKTAVFLYYYEGYSTPEIARMLDCPQSTVRSRLARARKLLEKEVCPQ